MADISPSKMNNKISFYREVLTVDSNGEKVKVLTLVKQNVGAEFKYIGTPSAGASEEQIQEQRTGKIKAEIRCRYIKEIKFEDLVYFEGGKFRIYSIQYEGRHKAIKIRAELRDDDTYFGLPSDEYNFIANYNSGGVTHARTSASYQVVENVPFPKQTGSDYVFESASTPAITIGDGVIGGSVSSNFVSNAVRFPYAISGDLQIPADGKIRSYTSAWYDMYPSNDLPYARIETANTVLMEYAPGGAADSFMIPADGSAPTHLDANGNKTYNVTTAGLAGVEEAFYNIPYGDNEASLSYRLTPITLLSNYASTLNSRDKDNSVTKIAGGVVYQEYEMPMTVTNQSLSFPTDITAVMFRQGAQLNSRMGVASTAPLLTSNSREKPKTGNLKITDGAGGLRVETINTVTVTKPDETEITSVTLLNETVVALSSYFAPTATNVAAGIVFVEGASLDSAWKGGKITFNVDYSPSPVGLAFAENADYATNQNLTYHIV